MRTLSATLLADQIRTDRVDALIKVVLTHGVTTYTYTRTRIIDVKHDEEPFSHKATLQLDNSDGTLPSLDLQGYQAVISYGVNTSAGEEYSACAPLWVTGQRFESSMNGLFCILECIGIPNLLAEQRAESDYKPLSTDTKTVKTIINDMFDGTMTAFSNSPTYTVDWDSEDGLIDVFIPKDHFRIYIGGSRLAALRRLLDYTGCSVRFGNDGHIHIIVVPMKELVFDGSANSSLACGAIHNADAKFWISFRFKLNTDFTVGSTGQTLFTKRLGDNDKLWIELDSSNGKLYAQLFAGGLQYTLNSAQTSWTAGTWYHVLFSLSDVVGGRLKINNGTAVTTANASGMPNGGSIYLGIGTTGGVFSGVIADVFMGNDALTTAEETALYNSMPPSDATEIYKLDEGEGLVAYNLGSSGHANDGTIGSANTWQARTTYDYEYSLASGYHTFFAKAYRKRLVIPNRFVVKSQADDSPQYTGTAAVDADSYAALGMYLTQTERIRLASDAQGTSIGAALLLKYQTLAQGGSGEVPMNVGAEVYDYVRVTDVRENDNRSGTIGYIHRHVNLRKAIWKMTFGFGGWSTSRGLLNDLETDSMTSAGLSQYFEKLAVKDLYAENIKATQIDLTTLDQDDIQDGTTYGRVKNTHLDSNGVKISSITTFDPGYDSSTKRRNFTATPTTPYDVGDLWHDATTVKRCTTARASGAYVAGDWTATTLDAIANGTTYSRVQTAALSAEGLVLMDQVVAGTYGLVLATHLSAGKLQLTSAAVKDAEWYKESGVVLDAAYGVSLYGGHVALRTFATVTAYNTWKALANIDDLTGVQCYVGTDGIIYAGGGAVRLSATGLVIAGAGYARWLSGLSTVGKIETTDTTHFLVSTWDDGQYLDLYGHAGIRLQGGGNVDVGTRKITGVVNPTTDQEAATKKYVDDTVSGGVTWSALTNSAIPQTTGAIDLGDGTHVWGKLYVGNNYNYIGSTNNDMDFMVKNTAGNNSVLAMHITDGDTPTLDMATHKIVDVADPTNDQEAATKNYVDTQDKTSSFTDQTASRALNTVYQNGTKTRFILLMATGTVNAGNPAVFAYIGSSNPPASYAGGHSADHIEATNEAKTAAMTFVVPANWYYKLMADSPLTLYKCLEWDLH